MPKGETPKPSKEVKRIMWLGNNPRVYNPDLVYEWHGMKFQSRTVQPVSDSVYEAVKNIHNFVTVESVRHSVFDFNNPEGKSSREMISGDQIEILGSLYEETNPMVF